MSQAQARLRQQVVGLRLGCGSKTHECGQEYHPLKIATLRNKSVI